MKIIINGNDINSEEDFHREIALKLNFPSYYGKNLDALLDILSTDVQRPLTLAWQQSESSKDNMGGDFFKISDILKKIEKQDIEWGLDNKFNVIFT